MFRLIFILSLTASLYGQSRINQEAPWSFEKEPRPPSTLEFYLPLEVFGGNVLNYGAGMALLDRQLDIQIQGSVTSYKLNDDPDDFRTWGFTVGADISQHFLFSENKWGLYYGLLYRYNHMAETEFAAFPDRHWTGLSLGAELHKDRLTFYGENLWFLENLYLDLPHTSFAGGVKLWLN